MGVFAVTFRVEKKSTKHGSYDERYETLVHAIKSQSDGMVWDETTSFILFNTDKTTSSATVAKAVDNGSQIDPSVDLCIVINLSQNEYVVIGKLADADIHTIMGKR